MRSKTKTIDAWTIYLWRNNDVAEGCAAVVTKDGIKEMYQNGWVIEPTPEMKNNEERHMVWRAKVKVKNLLNNTLNVLNWYGKKVLNANGEIDTEKLRNIEAQTALQAAKNNVGMEDLYAIRKFPKKEISIEEAVEYGLTKRR
ncbi:MAG: hypothetical protein WC803_12710 [Sphingomonas sp.]|jgi:hypothetical protein